MKNKVQTRLSNPVLSDWLKSAAIGRMSPAELRAWAKSPSGSASIASLLKGAGPVVEPRAYVVRRESWGPGAGYAPAPSDVVPLESYTVEIVKGFPVKAVRPVRPVEVEKPAPSVEAVAANQYARELQRADAAYQASVSRDTLTAEAKSLAASKGETGARLANESRERAKVSASRVSQAREKGRSQSWHEDARRLLEACAEDSVERLIVSVAWAMAGKAIRRVEGGARKRSKAAKAVDVLTSAQDWSASLPDGFEGPGPVVGAIVESVTTGGVGATGADGWAGRAVEVSDSAKGEAFGAALEAATAALFGPVRLLASAPVGNFGTLCGLAWRAAYRSLTKLDGGGTGRKTGGESVQSSDTESGAASVARWDAGQAIGEFERASRFDTLPPLGLEAQRERAGRSIAFRFGLINGGEGAEGCDGCRALVGVKGASGERGAVLQAAKARRAVAGALLSVLHGASGAAGRVRGAGEYTWEGKDFLPQAAMSRWGASASRFESALRALGLKCEDGHTGGFAAV